MHDLAAKAESSRAEDRTCFGEASHGAGDEVQKRSRSLAEGRAEEPDKRELQSAKCRGEEAPSGLGRSLHDHRAETCRHIAICCDVGVN